MLHACILCTALRIMLLHRVQIVYPPFHPYSVLCPGNLAWGAERGMGSRPRYPSEWLFPHQGQGEVQHSEGVRRLAELIFWWSGIGAHGNIFVFFPGTSWDHFLWSNILAFEKKIKALCNKHCRPECSKTNEHRVWEPEHAHHGFTCHGTCV